MSADLTQRKPGKASRRIFALHVYSDWAVRPGVTLATFPDGSRAVLFDSFKPACGYSTFWFVVKLDTPGHFWHLDVREIVPGCAAEVRTYSLEPPLKMAAFHTLLVNHFPSAAAFMAAAEPVALLADPSNNELRKSGAA